MQARRAVILLVLVGLTFMAGVNQAAAGEAKTKPARQPELVWPLPPDKPRIKWLQAFSSSKDIGGDQRSLFQKFVLGNEPPSVVMRKPYGLAVDREGRVYVTDTGKQPGVLVFDSRNKRAYTIGVRGRVQLQLPIGVAVDDEEGTVWVSDAKARAVFSFTKAGEPLSAIGQEGELVNPTGLAVDSARKRLYVADSKAHVVQVYRTDGTRLSTIGAPGIQDGYFNYPTNLVVDRNHHLYVVDTMNFRVQVFDEDGQFVRKFGELGDTPGSFSRPRGIALDTEDHVYVVDAAFNNYQIFDREGRLLLYIGNGGASPGQFHLPAGIAIDAQNRIHVVDQLNARIQVFQFLGSK